MSSRSMLPFMALHVVNEFRRSGTNPPLTAGLILANTLIYLRPGPLDRILPSIRDVAFNPNLIFKYGDLKRLFLSAFYHANEPHLVYNMISLVWKGTQLEASMGGVEFASMVSLLLGLSQGLTLILAKSLFFLFDYKAAYYNYSVGFSGVLFAMKMVLNAQSDNYSYVHGMIIPTRYAAWVELILIQLFVPDSSFLGHLGGILAGLLYLWLRRSFSGSDPLTAFIEKIARIVSWPLRFVRGLFRSRRNIILGRGTVGRRQSGNRISSVWRCPTCTYDNSVWVDVCEMCSAERMGREFTPTRPSGQSDIVDLDELRRRRLERFGRGF